MASFAAAFLAGSPFDSQTTDTYGNIFNASGTHIGVVANSIADVGSKGAAVPASSTGSPAPASSSTDSQGLLSKVGDKVSSFVSHATGMAEIENIIIMGVGLILILAGVFSFKPARDVAVGAVKTGAKVGAVAAV